MVRYTALSIVIVFFIIAVIRLSIDKKRGKLILTIRSVKEGLPSVLALSLTFCFFLPASLVINNNDDFLIGIRGVLPIVFLSTIIFSILLISVLVIISSDTLRNRYLFLLLGLAGGLYLQANWINPKLPELDGRRLDWSAYLISGIINLMIWFAVIILPQVLINRNKVNRTDKALKYTAGGIVGIQLIVFVITLILPKDSIIPSIRLIQEGEFSLGKERNVIVFVMDSLGAPNYEKTLSEYPEIADTLDDFTYFDNNVAGGSYTDLGLPTLLTGVEYDPEYMSYSDYLADAWSSVDIYDELAQEGYDIRLYTDCRYITGVSEKIIGNLVSGGDRYYIEEEIPFTKQLYKLTGYFAFPTLLKQFFWMNTTDITKYITSNSESIQGIEDSIVADEAVFFDDNLFHERLDRNGISIGYDKAYRVYHMVGPHVPYTLSADGYTSTSGTSDESSQIAGCFKIVDEYISEMKEKEIYDNATIIITADHGPSGIEYGMQQNSCLLIKQAGKYHEYEHSTAPIHARNVLSTIADEAGLDYMPYGPRIWDIDETSDVERLHTARRASIGDLFPEIPEDQHSARFDIGSDATEVSSIEQVIGSERNRIGYNIGDIIDFSADSVYTRSLKDRLYYDKTGALASNELYICLVLNDYSDTPMQFNFTYDKVYNDTQKVRIYVEGERIATFDCKQEQAGTVVTVDIPKEYIRDNIIPLRMVFPGAVTPHMLDINNEDNRIYSVHINKIWINEIKH